MGATKKNILITGGAGFIGQKLCHELLQQGNKVRVLDNFSSQVHSSDSLPNSLIDVEVVKADIRDRGSLRKALVGVDVVVHLAAETGTGQSMYEIEKYFSVNVQGTALLIDLLQNDSCARDVKSVIVASSRAIYGEGAYACEDHGQIYPEQRSQENLLKGSFDPLCPICQKKINMVTTPESAPFNPMSIYGLTKQVQEQAILLFAKTKGINGFALRYQNVYGPGQSLKNPYTGLLAVFSNLARQNRTIEVYEDGEESRDFVYISDVVNATVLCVNATKYFCGSLNIGSGVATSVSEVANKIKAHFHSSSDIKITGAYRVGDIRHNIADLDLANRELGYAPKVFFEEGVKCFLNWAEEQPKEDGTAYERSINELASKGLMGQSDSGVKAK